MSWHPAPPGLRPPTPPLLAWLRSVFSSDHVLTSEGAGGNLVELLAELVRAIDANTEQIRRFNDRRDREDGAA